MMAVAKPKYVVDELLMYTFSKLDTDTPGDVKNVVCTFYGDEALSDAKGVLWDYYG